MARRRKGFTFVATDPDTGVRGLVRARGYTFESAKAALIQAGYGQPEATNLNARGETPGQAHARRQSHRPADGGGWSLRGESFRALLDREGIDWPVVIRQSGRAGGRRGVATIDFVAREHTITVKNYLTPERAERTIRHEVEHCRQAEALDRRIDAAPYRVAQAWARAYSAGRTTYLDKPLEVAARAAEDGHSDLTLVRPSNTPDQPRRFAGKLSQAMANAKMTPLRDIPLTTRS